MIPEGKDEIFSARGRVLIHIAVHPDCTIPDLTQALCLTSRTIWGHIGDLRRAEMLRVRKEGRCHHYAANLDAPLLHLTVKGYILYDVLHRLVERVRG